MLRLLSYNIRFGGTGREDALAAAIRSADPDVVLLQEASQPDVVARLSRLTGLGWWGAAPGQSCAFLSRTEVEHHAWHRPAPSRRAFLELVPAGSSLRLFGVHLSAIHSNWTEARRVHEVHAVRRSIERHQHGLHVVAGDFNTLAPGEELDVGRLPIRLRAILWATGGRIRWRTIQAMLDGHYVDGWRHLHPEDAGSTFPTWDPHLRLDFAFLPQPFAERLHGCRVLHDAPRAREASDHFPLLAEVATGS